MKNKLKISVLVVGFMSVLASSVLLAQDAAPAPAQQPAAQQAPAQQPAAQPNKPAQNSEPLFTPAQKTVLQKLQQQHKEYLRQMDMKYEELNKIANNDQLDKEKVKEVTDAMVYMVRRYAESSTDARHDFYKSLTPEQKQRLAQIAKQQQHKMQQKQQQPAAKQ